MNVTDSMQEGAIKVLYMCEWTGRGIHPVWLQYAYGLRKAGACVYTATSGREYDPGTLQEAVNHNLHIVELPEFFDRENNFRNAARAMANWLSVNSVDIIHCQGYRELHDITCACRIIRQKHRICMTDRNSLAWTGLGALKRIALMLREKPFIIALSRSHYERLARIPGMTKKTAFIPNGVNTDVFPYTARISRCGRNRKRLIYPASFTPFKGHNEFLTLCRDIATGGRQFEVLFAGYGPLEECVQGKVNAMGLGAYVRQLGRVPWKQLPELYATCEIGVFPSLSEMMPNAVLEMMSSGLPVVAYDTGGIRQMIEHGRTGFVAPVGDKRRFQFHLEQLMDNEELAHTIGAAASVAVRDGFTVEEIGKRTLALYTQFIGNS